MRRRLRSPRGFGRETPGEDHGGGPGPAAAEALLSTACSLQPHGGPYAALVSEQGRKEGGILRMAQSRPESDLAGTVGKAQNGPGRMRWVLSVSRVGWVRSIWQWAGLAGWRGRGVLTKSVWRRNSAWRKIAAETGVMAAECPLHLNVSFVEFNKKTNTRSRPHPTSSSSRRARKQSKIPVP